MKRLFYVLLIAIVSLSAASAKPSVSPLAQKMFMHSKLKETSLGGSHTVGMLIKYNNDFDFAKAELLGVKFPTTIAGIATARVPISSLTKFAELPGLVYIDSDPCAAMAMDSARSVARINNVINGTGLPEALNGENVVIGIIDAGFDYTHPVFFDTVSQKLIISRVWEQGKLGNAPAGFDYGRELKTTEDILAAQRDTTVISHGSHVAGISAGQNVSGIQSMSGVAKKAELVFVALKPPSQDVWTSATGSDFVDAANYIFKYAESVGKPAVVNLSWGGQMGPHDGTSLFSQAIDGLVGAGKIFVTSAGNDGEVKLHLRKEFTSTDTNFHTYISNVITHETDNGIWFDIWGETGKHFDIDIAIIDSASKTVLANTGRIASSSDSYSEMEQVIGADTCILAITRRSEEYNGRPHIFVHAKTKKKFWFSITGEAKEGSIDMWNWYLINYSGIETPFVSLNDTTAVAGDTKTTISDFASTKRAIGVGAMVSKRVFRSIDGNQYNYPGASYSYLAKFSSHGPSADGRIKPDITAPGMALVSAVNSFDPEYAPNGEGVISVIKRVTVSDRSYPYAIMAGTSMSSPLTSGAVALLLSAKPTLTPEETIDLLARGAIVDTKTGSVPNNDWGNGKLNLTESLKIMLGISGINEDLESENIAYPNPFSDKLNLNIQLCGKSRYYLFNSAGELVLSEVLSTSSIQSTELMNLPVGAYILAITDNGKIFKQKLIKK